MLQPGPGPKIQPKKMKRVFYLEKVRDKKWDKLDKDTIVGLRYRVGVLEGLEVGIVNEGIFKGGLLLVAGRFSFLVVFWNVLRPLVGILSI